MEKSVILLLLSCFRMLLVYSYGDALTRDQPSIRNEDKLVSANDLFILGFFEFEPTDRYLGIMCRKDPTSVVWVANRGNPITSSSVSVMFTIQSNGNLAVLDDQGTEYWSANVSTVASSNDTFAAVLQNDGNLVLKRKSNPSPLTTPSTGTINDFHVIWQSFDYPTNVLLPGMKIGINLRTNQTRVLTSWKSNRDPHPGNFEFGIDPDVGRKQFFIWRRSVPYLRAVFWNGTHYDYHRDGPSSLTHANFTIIDNSSEVYFTLSAASRPTCLYVSDKGQMIWLQISTIVDGTWMGKIDDCSQRGGCGAYSVCNVNKAPRCNCLPGFEPKSDNASILSGCQPKTTWQCTQESHILSLKGIEVPYVQNQRVHELSGYLNVGDCQRLCRNRGCFCKGFAFIANDSVCRIWVDDLMDLREEEHPLKALALNLSVGLPFPTSAWKLHERQCENCGANVVPYPLSTGPSCGLPNYNALYCNTSNGQLRFRTPTGSYAIRNINSEAKALVIRLEGVDLCWAKSSKRNDIHLNSSLSFRFTTNTVLLFNCSTNIDPKLNCTSSTASSSACRRFTKEGGAPCYNMGKCCSYALTDPHKIGVLNRGCTAYTSIVGLNLSRSIDDWWEGVEVSWEWEDASSVPGNGEKVGKKRQTLKISVPVVIGVVSAGTILYFLWTKRTKKRGASRAHDSLEVDIPFYEFEIIEAATGNFSDSNKLGRGGFGDVYKGTLPEGHEVAVKRLSKSSAQGQEEFKNEIILIAKLQHRNLVRIIGYCIQGDEKILLYEYMPNKSLDYFLFDPIRSKLLSWEMRYDIIVGIANGLLYLHDYSRLRIIHRDLKTSNILLDEEIKPKISDFGMARIFRLNQTQQSTQRVVGTYGYMSPEYASHGLFSVKSDVFSFGVILLEIVSGRKNALFFHGNRALSLLGHAWELWMEGKWMDVLDENLDASKSLEVRKCIQIGLLCVQDDAADRPTMTSVVAMFAAPETTLDMPKQPAFMKGFATNPFDCSSGSRNEITFSTFEGR